MTGQNHIWEYLRGKRTGRMANQFERKTLSDPFLYEAIEGLETVEGEHEQIVGDLEKQLRYRLKRKRVLVYRWVMAASFILLTGIAVTFLYKDAGQEQLPLMVNLKHTDDSSAERSTDSLQMASVPLEGKRKDAVNSKPGEIKVETYMRDDKQQQTTIGKEEQNTKEEVAKIDSRIASKVVLMAEDTGSLEMTRYLVKAAGPSKKVNPDTSCLDEIVVVGTGKRNKNSYTGSAGEIKTMVQEADTVKSERKMKRERRVKSRFLKEGPILDKKYFKENRTTHLEWQKKFDRYVVDSLRYPEDARLKKIEGEVQLAVRLNRKGVPGRIKLLQRLSPSCDREAIRLVEEYPGRWENTEKEILLTIPFRLPANH